MKRFIKFMLTGDPFLVALVSIKIGIIVAFIIVAIYELR